MPARKKDTLLDVTLKPLKKETKKVISFVKETILPVEKKKETKKKVVVTKAPVEKKDMDATPKQKKNLEKFLQSQKKRSEELEKHRAGKKSKLSEEEALAQEQLRTDLQSKIGKQRVLVQKLSTDSCFTTLIKSMDVIKNQLEKNPVPSNNKDRERVILHLIKINLIDQEFKDRQKNKREKEYLKAARIQIKHFFKVLKDLK